MFTPTWADGTVAMRAMEAYATAGGKWHGHGICNGTLCQCGESGSQTLHRCKQALRKFLPWVFPLSRNSWLCFHVSFYQIWNDCPKSTQHIALISMSVKKKNGPGSNSHPSRSLMWSRCIMVFMVPGFEWSQSFLLLWINLKLSKN